MSLRAVYERPCVICKEMIKPGNITRPLKTDLVNDSNNNRSQTSVMIQKRNDLISWSHIECVAADDDRIPICKHWIRKHVCIFKATCLFRHPETEQETIQIKKKTECDNTKKKSRNRVCNDDRAGALRRWVINIFGDEYLRQGSGILDIAGGKGELAFELVNLNGLPTCVIDPRKLEVNRYCRKLEFGYYHRNQALKQYNTLDKPTERSQIKIPKQIRCFFEMSTTTTTTATTSNNINSNSSSSRKPKKTHSQVVCDSFATTEADLILNDNHIIDDDDGYTQRVSVKHNTMPTTGETETDHDKDANNQNEISRLQLMTLNNNESQLYMQSSSLHNIQQAPVLHQVTAVHNSSNNSNNNNNNHQHQHHQQFIYPKALSTIDVFNQGLLDAQTINWTKKGLSTYNQEDKQQQQQIDTNVQPLIVTEKEVETVIGKEVEKEVEELSYPTGIEITDFEEARRQVQNCSLLVGMHPDQAAEHILDFAIQNNIPCAFIPCCVYSSQFPRRKKPDGSAVRKYGDLIEYLMSKLMFCVRCTITQSMGSTTTTTTSTTHTVTTSTATHSQPHGKSISQPMKAMTESSATSSTTYIHTDTDTRNTTVNSNSSNCNTDTGTSAYSTTADIDTQIHTVNSNNNSSNSNNDRTTADTDSDTIAYPSFGIVEMDFEGKNLLIYFMGDFTPLSDPRAALPHVARGPAQPLHWWRLTDGYKEPDDEEEAEQ